MHVINAQYNAVDSSMDITFHNGHIYRYANVAPGHAKEMAATSDKGAYFQLAIKRQHQFKKLK